MAEILVVDDDDVARHVLTEAMRLEGRTALEAADGPSALQILLAATPMVALVDQILPGLWGTALLRRLFTEHPEVAALHRYVIVTASSGALPEIDRTFLASHDIPVLDKPFDVEAAVAVVSTLAQELPHP